MNDESRTAREKEDFSLVLGGPLYRLFLRVGLVEPSMGWLHRRIITLIAITWLPLVVLTLLAGSFASGVKVPFLLDLGAHVRFLISVPLLIGAELIAHRRIRAVTGEFLERGLIAPEDQARFQHLIAWAMRLRNSSFAEVLLLVVAYTGGYWFWRTQETLHVATWYASLADSRLEFTRAGYWYAFISLPIGRFILFRWYFRLAIWYLFLWRVSRLQLRLNALHPDRAGGLGFLEHTVNAFAPVLIAQSAFLAGVIGTQIWHEGATLPGFQLEIVAFVVGLMTLVLAPLTVFGFQMIEAKLAALREYGGLASRYSREFRQKWLSGKTPPDESLLGTGDIQSLADLANSFEVVRGMQPLPFDKATLLRLVILMALPLFPLTLTMIPLAEMVDRLIKLLL